MLGSINLMEMVIELLFLFFLRFYFVLLLVVEFVVVGDKLSLFVIDEKMGLEVDIEVLFEFEFENDDNDEDLLGEFGEV